MAANVHDICDFMIAKCCEAGVGLSALKLQKLLYYAQAWHLAIEGERLFEAEFEAWVHGPVCRQIYDRFKDSKSLYSDITAEDIRDGFEPGSVSGAARVYIATTLEEYAKLTGSQLEEMTHSEDPWIRARGNCRPTERCETVISDDSMAQYYGQRLDA